ncbi:MAG: DoxX family protein [Solirubrobacteraceae bacterium]
MGVGLFVLRVVTGALFAGHGTRKRFGWFGGGGLERTGRSFESLGLRPGRMMALVAGLAELLGGALFALGIVTPPAPALLILVMSCGVATVHWSHGVWISEGGYEYNVVLIAIAFAVLPRTARRW